MEPSSHHNRSNIDVGIEKLCFEKTSFFFDKNNTLGGRGGPIAHFVPDLILWRVEEGGGQNRQKEVWGIQNGDPGAPQSRSGEYETYFGLSWAFGLIYDVFLVGLQGVLQRKSGQHGPNLSPKMEPKSVQNGVENESNFQWLLKSLFIRFWWIFG